MLAIIIAVLLMVGTLLLPMVIRVDGVWHNWEISGHVMLKIGPVPVLWIKIAAALDPITFHAVIKGIGMHERPLFQKGKEKPARSSRILLAMLRSVRCRKMYIDFELGIKEDAAATALGYGTLSSITQGVLLWAKRRGAKMYKGAVRAHFDESRYEGKIESIFSTTAAHIIVNTVKSGGNGKWIRSSIP